MIPDTPMVRTAPAPPGRAASGKVMRVLVVFDAIALLFAAALHVAGARIPLGSMVFAEPQIVPAAIVEGLAGLLFVVAAYALFAVRRWAWVAALVAHVFAILGFLLGLWATRAGTSPFNYVYHRGMLVVFLAGLLVLLTPSARHALRTSDAS